MYKIFVKRYFHITLVSPEKLNKYLWGILGIFYTNIEAFVNKKTFFFGYYLPNFSFFSGTFKGAIF